MGPYVIDAQLPSPPVIYRVTKAMKLLRCLTLDNLR